MNRILLISVLVIAVAYASHLEASFSLKSSGEIRLEAVIELRNDQSTDLYVLPWSTPADNLNGARYFSVFRDEEPLKYQGIVARRILPSLADFIQIKAFSSVFVSIDLPDGYDTSKAATYTVVMNDFVTTLAIGSLNKTESGLITEIVEGSDQEMILEYEGAPQTFEHAQIRGVSHTFSSCSAKQSSAINAAFQNFGGLMTRSVNALKSGKTSAVYKTWFGAYTKARHTKVENCIDRLKTTSDTGRYLFTCGPSDCDSGTIAYVYASDPSRMYICPTFFELPATGATSQTDTMTHEISHFHSTCSTSDVVYGQSGCKNLAKKKPGSAIKNADNYAFFSVFA